MTDSHSDAKQQVGSLWTKGAENERARTFFVLLLISCPLSGSSSPLLS